MLRPKKVVVVHHLDQACAAVGAAAEFGSAITCVTAPDAASYAGVGYLKAMADIAAAAEPGATVTFVIDCGEAPGLVLGAIRAGWRSIAFCGRAEVGDKLAAIAAESDARLVDLSAAERLDLLRISDPRAILDAWLAH